MTSEDSSELGVGLGVKVELRTAGATLDLSLL